MAKKKEETKTENIIVEAVNIEPKKTRVKKTGSEKAEVKETKTEQKKAPARKSEPKSNSPVFKTIIQVGDKEYDISDIAATAYKTYKSVHKRKVVSDFVVYVKPEENVAYYAVNGEGSDEYKIEL